MFHSDLIPIGTPAPEFNASLSDGTTLRLVDLRGRCVVLVFYPGDNTPVCTAQLCAFRDDWAQFQNFTTSIYGVNPASRDKHTQFGAKYKFPFPLIVDTGGSLAEAFGCRALFGLIRRTVYVIDRQGQIAYAQRGNPAPSEILHVLAALQAKTPDVK